MIGTLVNWVTVRRFCELTGYSIEAVDKKRQQGVWLEGSVWKHAPDNRILINIEGYHAWVEGKECVPQAQKALPSRSSIADRVAARRSASRQPPPTSNTRND